MVECEYIESIEYIVLRCYIETFCAGCFPFSGCHFGGNDEIPSSTGRGKTCWKSNERKCCRLGESSFTRVLTALEKELLKWQKNQIDRKKAKNCHKKITIPS